MTLTNWKDMTITWAGPRDHHNVPEPHRSMGIYDVRIAPNMRKNALNEDSFLIKDDTKVYMDAKQWDGDAYITEHGEFKTLVETYEDKTLQFNLTRSYILPPNEHFYVVKYSLTNTESTDKSYSIFDYITSSKSECSEKHWAWNDKETRIFMIDETKCGGSYFGTFSDHNITSYQIGFSDGERSPLQQWRRNQVLNRDNVAEDHHVQIGSVVDVTVKSHSTVDIHFYRILDSNYRSVVDVASKIRRVAAKDWFDHTSKVYSQWFNSVNHPPLTGNAKKLYVNSLILMKNSLNPAIGSYVASFHPEYGFKTWSRDAIFNAMAIDAVGFHDDVSKFYKWIASAKKRDDGSFHTCYSWWDGQPVGFVEPQYDSAGAFLWGVYYHYKLTKDNNFLNQVREGVRRLQDFLLQDGGRGLIKSDYSIWEESSDPHTGHGLPTSFFSFTQGLGYAGLISAAKLETIWNNPSRAQQLINRANVLKDAIERELWNEQLGYYVRSRWSDTMSQDTRKDSSSMSLIFSGAVSNKTRMMSHINHIVSGLTKRGSGIARYHMDPYFYDSIYSPGGKEVGEPAPPWGVVTMFTAWAELRQNIDIKHRLKWMVDHTAYGFMPVGEAIDGVTGEFVMSSCPDIYEHGSVYVWTQLMDHKMAQPPHLINE